MVISCGGGGEEEINDNSPAPAAVSPPPDPDNSAPSISGVPGNSVVIGESYFFRPTVSDPEGDTLMFSIQNLPGWASFDTLTGRLSGAPEAGDEGYYANIGITVTDSTFSAALSTFAISVNQVGLGSATLSWTAPTQNEDGSVLTDLTGYKFYYGTSQGSYGNPILVSNPGITSYVIENLAPNTYYFVVTGVKSSGIESSFSNEAVKIVL